MKTSNKILIAGVLLVLAALVVHDFRLRSAFKTKRYLDPYGEYTRLPINNFDEIAVTGANIANVKLTQGPYSVMVANSDSNAIRITQKGNRLQIDVVYNSKDREDVYHNSYAVYVSCPSVSKLSYNSMAIVDKDTSLEQRAINTWFHKNTVFGFVLDSLTIDQDNGSYVTLDSNRIVRLAARVGATKGSAPQMYITDKNKIGEARLWLHNYSKTEISGKCIATPITIVGDSATITYRGTAGAEFEGQEVGP